MANSSLSNLRYELTFFGSNSATYFPTHEREHATREDPEVELYRILGVLAESNFPIVCHTPRMDEVTE